MDQQDILKKKSRKLAAGLFGAAVMLLTLGAGCASQTDTTVTTEPPTTVDQTPPPEPTPAPAPEPSPTPVTTPPPTPKPGKSSYKDGSYTAEGDYMTHVGPESIHITLTLKNDIVVDSQFQATPNAMMSGRYMDMFSANYKPMVIGQNIADLQLGNVSGSSLTPMGFNDAVAKIKVQAKA